MTVTLHIGASKCGSSAIQTALTANPIIARKDGSNIHYVALDIRNDRLIEGRNMINAAGVYKYKSSPSAKTWLPRNWREYRTQLKNIHPTCYYLARVGYLSRSIGIQSSVGWTWTLMLSFMSDHRSRC